MSQQSTTFSLPNDSLFYLNIDLKMLAILLFIILVCIFTMSLSISMIPTPHRYMYIEKFNNDNSYSYNYNYKDMMYSNYSRSALTAPDINTKTPKNMTFGTATRILTYNKNIDWDNLHNELKEQEKNQNQDLYFNINIEADLYVLGGQIYDKGDYVYQNYIAQLINSKSNEIIDLGTLKKDNDGLYRLKYSFNLNNPPQWLVLQSKRSPLDELINYNIVKIIHVIKNPKTNNIISSNVMLLGDLNKSQ